jgi:electron transfer flavoprotein alpha subunit
MKINVFIETNNNSEHPVSMEALVAAQKLKELTNGEVHAVVFNKNVSNQLTNYNIDSIISIEKPELDNYNPLYFLEAMSQFDADIYMFGHTYETRDWVPRLSARLNIPFISDCTDFNYENDQLKITRPIYQAKLIQELSLNSKKAILSFQAGSFSVDDLESGSASINCISPDLSNVDNTIQPGERFQESTGGVDLTAAELIVSIGRGIGKEENIPLVEELANKLNAQIGSSRPVVDAGWLDHSRQIGSSGQTVSPKLYFAIGVSGAIQHLVGMKGSKNIIAINKDPNAPIFEIADYAVIGDLLEILPKLTENL